MMTLRQQFWAALNQQQKGRLSRFQCGLCEAKLHRTIRHGCNAIYGKPCDSTLIVNRAIQCLNDASNPDFRWQK